MTNNARVTIIWIFLYSIENTEENNKFAGYMVICPKTCHDCYRMVPVSYRIRFNGLMFENILGEVKGDELSYDTEDELVKTIFDSFS